MFSLLFPSHRLAVNLAVNLADTWLIPGCFHAVIFYPKIHKSQLNRHYTKMPKKDPLFYQRKQRTPSSRGLLQPQKFRRKNCGQEGRTANGEVPFFPRAMPDVGARNVRRRQMAGAGRTPPCAFSSLHFANIKWVGRLLIVWYKPQEFLKNGFSLKEQSSKPSASSPLCQRKRARRLKAP
ncbi:MAG: hypothetical protein P4N59_01310 [Negativicutes bacterium]|nr:hypothetical protein [Negativicutes bacterium]